jgi:hypothetical protein
VNWTVVSVVGVLTLGIGITVAVLSNSGRRGGIVVPQPNTSSVSARPTTSQQQGQVNPQINPAAGSVRTTPTTTRSTTRATTLPGNTTR